MGSPDSAAAKSSTKRPPEVVEELRVLDTVKENLARLKAGPAQADLGATLVSLRDSLADEKLPEDISSIMEQMDRTAALMNQQAKHAEGTADPMSPYFARMTLSDEHGKRSILLGKTTFISDRVRIVDWRNAPISRLFYQYGEGDEYDEVVNGRSVSGEVLLRRTMTIADGELLRVQTDDATFVRNGDDWVDMRSREARLSGGAGTAIRPDMLGTGHSVGTKGAHGGRHDKHLPEIASLLDPDQFKLITSKDSGLVVIQGSAGSGKTTVGLHRIAWLAFQNPNLFRPEHMLIVVFSRALAAYISKVLPALGVDGVRVSELGPWAERLRKAHYPNLPDLYSDDTPAVVTRFKTHTAVLKMIDELGRRRGKGEASPRELFEELFTNKEWIAEGLARHAPQAFTEAEVDRIHRWCVRQSFLRDDGHGSHEDEVPSLDREDDPILLRLWQVLRGSLKTDDKGSAGKGKKPLQYDHLMVDEAQDLSPIELAVLIGCSGERQSVTLAGDVAQKVMEHREFPSWIEVLDALRLGHIDVSPLQVSYRSTRQIMEVARQVLGPLAPAEPITAPRDGAPVGHLRFRSKGEAATWLGPALSDLMRREALASVAVLTVDQAAARDWYQILERSQVPYLNLVDDQDFSFSPGVEVTDIRSSKGLEFDYVVVVGVDSEAFPAKDPSRHLLHVGATRAAHQLWLVSTGTPSPLVPDGLPGLPGLDDTVG
jgi:DNA helicase-2/ATP-dependent DNA helicase PcrA